LTRITTVLDIFSIAFQPKCGVLGGVSGVRMAMEELLDERRAAEYWMLALYPFRARSNALLGVIPLQALCKGHACMTHRVILDDGLLLVAHTLIEARSLETVSAHEEHGAAPEPGVFFCRQQECSSESMSAFGLVDPKVGDIAATSPRVAADSSPNDAGIVALRSREGLPIKVPRRVRVELIDTLSKERLSFRGVTNVKND
jgi:hypothetical protein